LSTRSRALTAALSIALVVLALTAAYAVRRGYPAEFRDRLGERGTPAQVVDLQDIGELQAAFNQDAGTPRLVVLFSPT
jgi:hypothetical protein